MRFVSTRAAAGAPPVGFREAVFAGLAPDGGLYVPQEHPHLAELFRGFSPQTPFLSVAEQVLGTLLGDELGRPAVSRVVRRAFTFEPRLVRLEEGLDLLELFHGPTCAFKDFGAAFLAAVMEELLGEEGRRAVILVATSGDTGSAVARAFFQRRNLEVVILYPSGRVSPLQEQQLTTLGGNVTALEVLGSFDDCQRLAKEAFLDRELGERLSLTSANSINLGRLLPQALYYVYGVSRSGVAAAGPPLHYCVPSGNFGNLTAGVYAWRWGLPVAGFVAATNVNDVVPEYLRTGVFRPRASRRTLSNAMDVGNPSNFERLLRLFGGDADALRSCVRGLSITDAETRRTMRRLFRERGVLVDPHTAVGVLAARRVGRRLPGARFISLATAHPGKFVEVVREATGVEPPLPESLRASLSLPKQSVRMEPSLGALKAYLSGRYA